MFAYAFTSPAPRASSFICGGAPAWEGPIPKSREQTRLLVPKAGVSRVPEARVCGKVRHDLCQRRPSPATSLEGDPHVTRQLKSISWTDRRSVQSWEPMGYSAWPSGATVQNASLQNRLPHDRPGRTWIQPPQASGCSISRVPIQTPFGVGPLHQQPALSLHMWLSQGNFASFKLAHLCLVLDKQENQPPRGDQLLQTCMRNARVQHAGESINIGTLPKAGKALGKRTLAVHSTLPEENCTLCRSLIRTGIMHARCLAYLTRITAYQQSVYLF